MDLKELAALYREMGNEVLSTPNMFWLLRKTKVAYSLPMQENCFPSQDDFKELFKCGARVALYKSDVVAPNTFEYLFEGTKYDLDMFDSKIRNQIRKGLKSCEIRDVPLDVLREDAYEINVQTLAHQQRRADHLGVKSHWEKYITALRHHDDVFIKGAFSSGKLIGYAIIVKINYQYVVEHPYIDRNASSLCPMNAILYTFINEMLVKEGRILISYGMASFAEQRSLDKFKIGMLFDKKECGRGGVINPRLKFLFNPAVKWIVDVSYKAKILNARLYESYKILDRFLPSNAS